ncbi:MAG: hypothetical protein WAU91_14600 [Desulfatitalea sp.]
MADLVLSGLLNLKGQLALKGDAGGKVKVGSFEVLVEVSKGVPPSQGQGVPVLLPPPPASPTDPGIDCWIFKSFNATVTAGGKNIVTQGMCAQGNPGTATWPGMVQPSMGNPTVTINNIAINVQNDMATILPTGTPAVFTSSGQ